METSCKSSSFRKCVYAGRESREEQRDEGGPYFTVRMNECRVVTMLSSELLSPSRSDGHLAAAKEQFLPSPEGASSLVRTPNPSGCRSRDPCDMKGA